MMQGQVVYLVTTLFPEPDADEPVVEVFGSAKRAAGRFLFLAMGSNPPHDHVRDIRAKLLTGRKFERGHKGLTITLHTTAIQ